MNIIQVFNQYFHLLMKIVANFVQLKLINRNKLESPRGHGTRNLTMTHYDLMLGVCAFISGLNHGIF